MALDKTRMATNVADAMIAAGIITADKKADVVVIWEEICYGIIQEFTSNAVVAVTSVSGVTSGIEDSGSGSGSIS